MVVTPELLSTFQILKPLPLATLMRLAPQCVMQRFVRRGVVLNAGLREPFVCFLFEGRLQGVDFTIDGREVGLYFVEPGDFCGELALFDGGPQPEYIIARTSAMVVAAPMEAIRDIMMHHPTVVNVLGVKLASRVRQMTAQRSLLGLPNISQRVCCQLWMLVPEADKERVSATSIRGIALNNAPTHMEIAIMLNISRETVTRVFQALQLQQVVKRDGPTCLLINDLQILKDLAEGTRDVQALG